MSGWCEQEISIIMQSTQKVESEHITLLRALLSSLNMYVCQKLLF